jgi:predicted transcriptional regulator
MNNRKILISICSLDEYKKTVRASFKRAEAGQAAEDPIHRVYFTSEEDLFSTLSPKRLELLKFLKKTGALSCRQLSLALNRAYANVHEDVKQLMQLELIQKDDKQKLVVPWDEIDIAVPLVAVMGGCAQTPRQRQAKTSKAVIVSGE